MRNILEGGDGIVFSPAEQRRMNRQAAATAAASAAAIASGSGPRTVHSQGLDGDLTNYRDRQNSLNPDLGQEPRAGPESNWSAIPTSSLISTYLPYMSRAFTYTPADASNEQLGDRNGSEGVNSHRFDPRRMSDESLEAHRDSFVATYDTQGRGSFEAASSLSNDDIFRDVEESLSDYEGNDSIPGDQLPHRISSSPSRSPSTLVSAIPLSAPTDSRV